MDIYKVIRKVQQMTVTTNYYYVPMYDSTMI